MKLINTTPIQPSTVVRLEDGKAPDATSYAMRVEFQTDAFIIRAALAPWVSTWKESWFVDDGVRQQPDMEVEFQLAWKPPTFTELQWMLASLPDCHVAAESLMPIDAYTGDRIPYDSLRSSMTKPTPQAIRRAREGQKGTLEWLPILTDALRDSAVSRRSAKRT